MYSDYSKTDSLSTIDALPDLYAQCQCDMSQTEPKKKKSAMLSNNFGSGNYCGRY